jgi:uncharacterized protein YdhG (YjbR/CyaY superfamily)
MKKLLKPKNVDAYIAAAPKEVQSKLQELRAAIKAAAPKAEEQISYGMPYYVAMRQSSKDALILIH